MAPVLAKAGGRREWASNNPMRTGGVRRQSVGLRRELSVLRWGRSRTVLYGAILRLVSYKPGWAEQEVVRAHLG